MKTSLSFCGLSTRKLEDSPTRTTAYFLSGELDLLLLLLQPSYNYHSHRMNMRSLFWSFCLSHFSGNVVCLLLVLPNRRSSTWSSYPTRQGIPLTQPSSSTSDNTVLHSSLLNNTVADIVYKQGDSYGEFSAYIHDSYRYGLMEPLLQWAVNLGIEFAHGTEIVADEHGDWVLKFGE